MNLTLAAWLHNLSPFLVQFSGSFGLRWYGLAYAIGFLVGWWWLRSMSRRGMTPLSPQRLSDAMLILVLGVVVGGRLGYVLFYDRELLTTLTSTPPWWGVFQLNKGGMSSHGGIVGVIIATWFIARASRSEATVASQPTPLPPPSGRGRWLHVMDLMAVACTPGLMFGRIANFINGELLGKIVAMPGQPAPWWAVKFPQERLSAEMPKGHAPVLTIEQAQQMDAFINHHRVGNETDTQAFERALHVLQKGGEAGAKVAAQLEPLISARYPSQLMQAATDGLILGAALWFIWRRPRKPGVIGCWFLILYGVMRISTEFVRLPDPQLTLLKQETGFSMGQWLSVGMVVAGFVALPIVCKRGTEKLGGWAKTA